MNDTSSLQIAVIGAGLMGHGIAQEFAQHGYRVSIYDKDMARRNGVPQRIETNLRLMIKNGLLTDDAIPDILSRIHVTEELEKAVKEALFVVEAVFEDLPLKQSLFHKLDRLCPREVTLASNSSSFTPSQYAQDLRFPERVIGTHYFNPPYLVPLVEIIKGPETSTATLEWTRRLLEGIGKKVVVARKEVPGFIANRIQMALFREALNVVAQGIATPEEVDIAVKNSFGRRLGVMGPFEQCDIIGADLKIAIYRSIAPSLCHRSDPLPPLVDNVEKNTLGMKTGQGFYTWSQEAIRKKTEAVSRWLAALQDIETEEENPSAKEGKPEDKGGEG